MPNRLKDLREAKKLTQEQLAELAGTSNQQVSFLENGKRGLSKKWAERLAPLLGVSPADLMFDGGKMQGFAEADAQIDRDISELDGHALSPNQSVWIVGAKFTTLPGYAPGDRFLLDMGVEAREGDDVLANIADLKGGAETVLRRLSKGWLVGNLSEPLWVDDVRVRIMGVVTRRWWSRAA